jgi:hypothetical protein
VQFLSFLLVVNWYNHSIFQHTTSSIDETVPHVEQIMPTLPEHLMIIPVFVKFTLLVFYVCGVRVKSCLFVVDSDHWIEKIK